MRIIFFLVFTILVLSSCNNDLTTIGQDLIYNENQIEVKTSFIEQTGTVRLDSFITSSGRYGDAISQMFMGRYEDQMSGTTVTYPCFQLVPSSTPNIAARIKLDSVTFHFKFGNKLWGDTISSPQIQTFDLYRLSELPYLNTEKGEYIYNVAPIAWGDSLGRVSFLPKRANMKEAEFKLENNDFFIDLFEKMKYEDPIFKPSANSAISYFKFLNYFKGLAIKTAEDNNCIIGISMLPDSLFMRFHYHDTDVKQYYDLKLLTQSNAYQYNAIYTQPADPFKSLTNQRIIVPYSENDIAITQGMSGYMIKLILPFPDTKETYKTVVKAEIELKPLVWPFPDIALPSSLYVYSTNTYNEVGNIVYNSTNNPIVGKYVVDSENIDNNRYIFDITDYYQNLVNTAPITGKEPQFLLTLPDMTNSFERVIIKEKPILRVYYASYKD